MEHIGMMVMMKKSEHGSCCDSGNRNNDSINDK